MRSMMGGSTTVEEGLRELASSTPSRVGLFACDVHSSTTSSPATDGSHRHALEAAEDTSLPASWCCKGAVAACAIVVLAMCDRLKARDRCRDHLHRPGDAIIRPPKGVASRWAMSGKRGDGDRDHIGSALTRASLGRRQIFSSVRGLPADRLRAVACRSTDSDSREPRIGKTCGLERGRRGVHSTGLQ